MGKEVKHFSTTIVEQIKKAATSQQLLAIGHMIKMKALPIIEGHDRIIEAWLEQSVALDVDDPSVVDAIQAKAKAFSELSDEEQGIYLTGGAIADEVLAMSEDEVRALIEEHGLTHLTSAEYLESILAKAAAKADSEH